MKKLWNFNKFNFIKEHMITEDTEFMQYQFGVNQASPLGPGYGFAVDPSLSIYGDKDSPYTDYYSRTSGLVKDLMDVIDFSRGGDTTRDRKFDHFLNDMEKYENLKILRISENQSGYMNVYLSYDFDGDEYFGVYKDFNKPYIKPILETELISASRYKYMNKEYYLKLDNYLHRILETWFTPKKGFYKNLKEGLTVKDRMGQLVKMPKKRTVEMLGQYTDENSNPYLELKMDGEVFRLSDNKYYYFNYWFEPLPKLDL